MRSSLFFVHVDLFSDYYGFVCRYAQYGDVSPKVDVYAFGVVLYELISAKEAIVKTGDSVVDSKGLVALVNLDFSTKAFIIVAIVNILKSTIFIFLHQSKFCY